MAANNHELSPADLHGGEDSDSIFTTYGDVVCWNGMPVARIIESTTIMGGNVPSARDAFIDRMRANHNVTVVPMPTPRGK